MSMQFDFPKNFTWGAATASYQIEGAANKDGRGKSTWDVFCEEPGRVSNGDSGAVACDHYHRWKSDIALMKELNLQAYRFSLAWSRIFPEGDGPPNRKGVEFYDSLIDGLMEAGIEPYITLFHWDLPWSLQERFGGWRSRETVNRFADYASFCAQKFGDRVKNWFTINEIICFTHLAHNEDRFAPGGKLSDKESNQTIHHALVGHGMALQAVKAARPDAKAGLVENINAVWPLYETTDNVAAARKAFHEGNQQRLFPAMTGQYITKLYEAHNGPIPEIADGDMEIIGTQADFIAFNFYQGTPVIATDNESGWKEVSLPEDFPKTDMGWPITPKGLYWSLKYGAECFPGIPLYITENGIAQADIEERDGSVNDVGRLDYYRRHLEACSMAIAEGVPLNGYFAWSLMDNFEWADGYAKRFGLIRVNYHTQERTIKASGRYYAECIRAGRAL